MALRDYPERVAAGAKLLDEHVPKWYLKIDLKTLAMDYCAKCVLGQLFDDYLIGVSCLLFSPGMSWPELRRLETFYGVNVEDSMVTPVVRHRHSRRLRELWVKEIQARQETA